jgi:hypothetical protein
LPPEGGLVLQDEYQGVLAEIDDSREWEFDLDAGESLSVAVDAGTGLTARATLRGPDGVSLAETTGTSFVLQTVRIPVTGSYRLTVTGDNGTTGSFAVDVVRNAAIEAERPGSPVDNNTQAAAQDLTGSFLDLADGLVSRGGVLGGVLDGGDREDWYAFPLEDGQVASLALSQLEGSSARLELYAADGSPLANGVSTGSVEQLINGFRDPTTDGLPEVYFLRVSDATGPYSVVATRNALFDGDEGRALSLATLLSPAPRALGFLREAVGAALTPLTSVPGIPFSGFVPPDPIVAAGPDRLVAMVNSELAIFDKSGAPLFRQALNGTAGFFGAAGARGTVFDPWVVYDHASERFFALGIELSGSSRVFVCLAVSRNAAPVSGLDWHTYRIDFTHLADGTGLGSGAHFPDYPKMSVGQDAVYVTGNYAPISVGSGRYAGITALAKAPLLKGDPASKLYEEHFAGSNVFPLQPYAASPFQYFAESVGTGTIRLHALDERFQDPARQTVELSVPEFAPPVDVPQLGGGVPLDSLSERVMTGLWRHGSAWFAHPIVDPAIGDGETVVRWYEVATNGFPAGEPELLQSGNVDPGPGVHAWSPALAVDAASNMAIGFSLGGGDRYAGAGYTGRLASDPAGTTTSPVFPYVDGQGNYVNVDTAGRNRWGDYSGLVVDPVDEKTFWVLNRRPPIAGPRNWRLSNSTRSPSPTGTRFRRRPIRALPSPRPRLSIRRARHPTVWILGWNCTIPGATASRSMITRRRTAGTPRSATRRRSPASFACGCIRPTARRGITSWTSRNR